jgi:hypothetical protein
MDSRFAASAGFPLRHEAHEAPLVVIAIEADACVELAGRRRNLSSSRLGRHAERCDEHNEQGDLR